MYRTSTRVSILTVVALAAALASCKGGHGADKSQVVARVNDAEITVSQLRTALAGNGEEQPSEDTMRAALDGLINEQLLVDAALRDKLDRDPIVVQAVEAARRQLLARAFLERSVFPKQDVSAAEQTAYYKDHPELFAQRRVYQLTAFTFPREQLDAGLVEALGAARSADSVAAALAAKKITAEPQTLTRAAEQLPFDQVAKFSAASVGDVIVQTQPERAMSMLVTGIETNPLSFVSAQPIIQQYLANERNARALTEHLREARATAKITSTDAALLAGTATPLEPSPPAAVRESRIDHGAAVLR
jgi:peptidyl-prolyl cis-trans isomerase C